MGLMYSGRTGVHVPSRPERRGADRGGEGRVPRHCRRSPRCTHLPRWLPQRCGCAGAGPGSRTGPRAHAPERNTRISIYTAVFLLLEGERNTFGLSVDKAFPASDNELMQQPKSLFILLLPT